MTKGLNILKIRNHPELINMAACWFHDKWDIPEIEYVKSMKAVSAISPVPQWYILFDNGSIIAGCGIIENDFHDRPDLSPNLCALYVDEKYRNRGIAGKLLEHVCIDMRSFGLKKLYLVTDHDSFYERYGWTYLCMVNDLSCGELIRMYEKMIDRH